MASAIGPNSSANQPQVFYEALKDEEGKVLAVDLQVKMPDVTLKPLRGITNFERKEEEEVELFRNKIYKMFDICRRHFKTEQGSPNNDEESYRAIFTDAEGMANYGSGKPWSEEKVLTVLAFDYYRPIAGLVSKYAETVFPSLQEGTPYTGYGVYLNSDNQLIGRAAVGNSSDPERAESGSILHREFRKKGLGDQIELALLIIADVSKRLGHKIQGKEGAHEVKMFSADIRPSPETDVKIQAFGLEVLKGPYEPYPGGGERLLVGLDPEGVRRVVGDRYTINGRSPQEFYAEASNSGR